MCSWYLLTVIIPFEVAYLEKKKNIMSSQYEIK